MGAKQSQNPSSDFSPVQVTASPREEQEAPSIYVPPLFPLISGTTTSQESGYPQAETETRYQRDREEREPPTAPFNPVHLHDSEPPSEHIHRRHQSSSSSGHRERRRHHQDGSHHSNNQERSHHRRQHRDRDHQERRGNDRRVRRYVYNEPESSENPLNVDFDFSLVALNRRLQALQLRQRETEDTESSEGSARRHRGRSHTTGPHSDSRRFDASTLPASSLFFMRPPSRKSSCPFCRKDHPSDDMDAHMIICMTKPRVDYNEDQLLQDMGECSICLEDMLKGEKIARLPCLCVYHIKCLKLWFEKNRTCPEHPEFSGVIQS